MFDLAMDDVPPHYWRALKSLRTAFSYGEPIEKHPGVGQKSVDWLLEHGLVETVENPQYRSRCYRLTNLGNAVIRRGSTAQPRPRRRKLAMLQPRVAILKPRIARLSDR